MLVLCDGPTCIVRDRLVRPLVASATLVLIGLLSLFLCTLWIVTTMSLCEVECATLPWTVILRGMKLVWKVPQRILHLLKAWNRSVFDEVGSRNSEVKVSVKSRGCSDTGDLLIKFKGDCD